MPIIEYVCKEGHVTEILYLTFAEADAAGESRVLCGTCGPHYVPATRVEFSLPGQAILLGDGFYKPAASGRTQTKGADPSKAAKEFIGEIGGAQGLVKAVKGSK